MNDCFINMSKTGVSNMHPYHNSYRYIRKSEPNLSASYLKCCSGTSSSCHNVCTTNDHLPSRPKLQMILALNAAIDVKAVSAVQALAYFDELFQSLVTPGIDWELFRND